MKTAYSILIVEDEPAIASIFHDYLVAEGYTVNILHDGLNAVEAVRRTEPDLLLLDRMLPGKDGLSICQEIREFSVVPIIMITAKVDEHDRIAGLDAGADDYMCKPARPKEVVARVRALLRRSQINESLSAGVAVDFQDVNAQDQTDVRSLELSAEESRMLDLLSGASEKTMNAAQLQAAFGSTQTLDEMIKKSAQLSQKLAIVWQVDNAVQYNNDGTFSLAF